MINNKKETLTNLLSKYQPIRKLDSGETYFITIGYSLYVAAAHIATGDSDERIDWITKHDTETNTKAEEYLNKIFKLVYGTEDRHVKVSDVELYPFSRVSLGDIRVDKIHCSLSVSGGRETKKEDKGDVDGDHIAERDHFRDGLCGCCGTCGVHSDDWEEWECGEAEDDLLDDEVTVKEALTDFVSKITINPDKKIVSVTYDDHDTTIVKTHEEDDFDPYIGVALGMAYKIFGSKTAFRKWVDENSKTVKPKAKKVVTPAPTRGRKKKSTGE